MERLRIAISSCLLGNEVRWDGGHKRDAGVAALAQEVDIVQVCPEVELGLGVPREPIVLAGSRLVGVESGTDHTDRMIELAGRRVSELVALGIAGAVLKKGSPSCGVRSVLVRREGGETRDDPGKSPTGDATGVFAAVLLDRLAELPVVEEDAIADPAAREDFVARARAYAAQEMPGV